VWRGRRACTKGLLTCDVLAVNMMVKIARSGMEEGHHLGPLARDEGPWTLCTELPNWKRGEYPCERLQRGSRRSMSFLISQRKSPSSVGISISIYHI
jgi:hypothetical protein